MRIGAASCEQFAAHRDARAQGHRRGRDSAGRKYIVEALIHTGTIATAPVVSPMVRSDSVVSIWAAAWLCRRAPLVAPRVVNWSCSLRRAASMQKHTRNYSLAVVKGHPLCCCRASTLPVSLAVWPATNRRSARSASTKCRNRHPSRAFLSP